MNIREALKTFDLDSSLSLEELKMLYKKLALGNHPDRFPEASPELILLQSRVMSNINEAYETLLGLFEGETFGIDDILRYNFDQSFFKFYVKQEKPKGLRNRIHPDHKNESYRRLWHEIHALHKNNHGLALRCWEKAIFQLLPDLSKYPDIDGIIHNYIRDCSALLLRLGLFNRAFELVSIVVKLNCRSYYSFYPPAELVYMSILKYDRKYFNSIPNWENEFLKKFIFDDVRIHWAMLVSYYFSNQFKKALDNVETGLIIPINNISNMFVGHTNDNGIYSVEHVSSFQLTPPHLFDKKTKQLFVKQNNMVAGQFNRMLFDINCILIRSLVECDVFKETADNDIRTNYPNIAKIIGFHSYPKETY